MIKVYYNKDGFICDRYPTNYICEDESTQFLEVDDNIFMETLAAPHHFTWKLVDGKFQLVQYEEIPTDEKLAELRERREYECFHIINRGELWYRTLTNEQLAELQDWYAAWLNVTETLIVPDKPSWLK